MSRFIMESNYMVLTLLWMTSQYFSPTAPRMAKTLWSFGSSEFNRFKGRFLEVRMYHNFANLFYKLSESSFYEEISKFK